MGKEVADGIRVIGTVDFMERLLWDQVVDELIFAMPLRRIPGVDKYIAVAEEMGVGVRIVPDWQIHKIMYRPNIASMHFEEFLGVPTMALKTTSVKQKELLIKNAMDYAMAALLLGLFFPLLLFIAAAIKVASRGPVFFRQIAPQRNEITFENWMKMHLRYIDNWSLGLDMRILVRTAKAVLMGEGR